jgi:3-phenylpropionate/cinnamic acid dioxygenase small subunit
MEDARSGIERIVYGYADRVDAGDFAGMAELFAHALYKVSPDDPGIRGADAVRGVMESMVMRHDDGTPRTKHVTTNLVIEADAGERTARSRSYFTVFQQLEGFPLQPIIAGRYLDAFERVDDAWRLTERVILCDLFGDLSRHLHGDPFADR